MLGLNAAHTNSDSIQAWHQYFTNQKNSGVN
jgi:hypothetical protein